MLSFARSPWLLVLVACLASVGLAGCAQLSPAEQVESVRAQTTVELRSFAVREVPVAEPAAEEPAEGEAVEAEEASAEAQDAVPADVPVKVEIDFDLLVSCEADEPLDGLTVELEQVDGSENVKETRRLWLATPGLMRGVGAQYTVTVQDVEYVEGDGFSVTVRSPVPEAERSEYREFQGLGES